MSETDNTDALLWTLDNHHEHGIGSEDIADAAHVIRNLRRENLRLVAALAESDRQAEKLEALLEPHIKWDEPPPPLTTRETA